MGFAVLLLGALLGCCDKLAAQSGPRQLYQAYCNFDQGLCDGFTNSPSADYTFDLNYGRTPSTDTGPDGDCDSTGMGSCVPGNGQYIYLEASYPHERGKVAILNLPPVVATGPACLEFAYSMNGLAMGSLQAAVNGQRIWEKLGDQGRDWLMAQVPINETGQLSFTLTAIRGTDYTSDIGLDSVGFKNVPCNVYNAPTGLPTLGTTQMAAMTTLDICSMYPCANGGSCVSTDRQTFTCTCPDGYTGALCNLATNPCANSPCQHQGTCVPMGHFYNCTCPAGWIGANCSIQQDVCEAMPCGSNGICIMIGPNRFQCICYAQCQGVYCEQCATTSVTTPTSTMLYTMLSQVSGQPGVSTQQSQVNPCQRTVCQNQGICSRSPAGGFVCRCAEPFVGLFCERTVMTNLLSSCDFDSSWCDFYNAWFDDFDWADASGNLDGAPWTGPRADHDRPGTGKYIYASSAGRSRNTNAVVYSNIVPPGKRCFTFWYFMWGSGVGRLRMFERLTDQTLLTIVGNQGPLWNRAYVAWDSIGTQVGFQAFVGNDQYGAIAIDDVKIYWGYCWKATPDTINSKPLPPSYRNPPAGQTSVELRF